MSMHKIILISSPLILYEYHILWVRYSGFHSSLKWIMLKKLIVEAFIKDKYFSHSNKFPQIFVNNWIWASSPAWFPEPSSNNYVVFITFRTATLRFYLSEQRSFKSWGYPYHSAIQPYLLLFLFVINNGCIIYMSFNKKLWHSRAQ